MRELLRQAAWLALATLLSWWVFLRAPGERALPRLVAARPPVLDVTPLPSVLLDPAPEPEAPSAAPAAREEDLVLPESRPPLGLAAHPVPAPAASAPAAPEPAVAGEIELAAAAPNVSAPNVSDEPPAPDSRARQPGEQDERDAATEATPAATPAPAADVVASEPRRTPPEATERKETAERAASIDPAPLPVRDERTDPPEASAAAPSALDARASAPASPPAAHVGDAHARSVEMAMHDPTLLSAARDELERGETNGFRTVLLALPEEQVAIARFFGEELVLVPRVTILPGTPEPSYFRLSAAGEPEVERVAGAPPLERHRQYRDLFDYEYGRLPGALRELRRSVLARGEVYLFAALLSPEEWALVIARRRDALSASGRELADARRFVLRYVHRPSGGFDLAVDEIVFADGTRFRPEPRPQGE